MKYVIGIDPDSNKHGVAEYWENELVNLRSMRLMDLRDLLESMAPRECIEIHIEDVCAKKATWHGKDKGPAVKSMSDQRVGMCKQAQREVEYLAEYLDVKIIKHPISNAWKSQQGKAQFQKVTGWTGRSNEDTRSAAYFGFLGLGK